MAAHPAYGLGNGWQGLRWIGDVEFENDELAVLGLSHGDPTQVDAPTVEVITTRDPSPRRGAALGLRTLGSADVRLSQVQTMFDLGERLADVQVRICGQRAVGEGVRTGARWLLRFLQGELTLYVAGRGIDVQAFARGMTIELVDDLSAYLAGRERLLRSLPFDG